MSSFIRGGAIALGLVAACGGDDSAPQAISGASGASGAGGSDGTTGYGVVTPVVCGGQGQHCCASGSLCAAGLSCSDEYCLRCGAATAPATGCTNVAAGRTSSAASYGGGAGDDPAKVVDGDVCTSWNYGSYGDANARWQVDTGSVYAVDALILWPKMTPAEGTVQFLIEHKKSEAEPWTGWPTSGGLALTLYDYQPWQTTFTPPLEARYFRVTIQGTPSFAALREVAIYAQCAVGANHHH